MLEKAKILIIVYALLFVFYIVISWGAGKKIKTTPSHEIAKYLFGVRVLIIVIAIVSFVLWLFL